MPNKSKFVTVILSVLPGVGHLYLGWQLRGLLFMLAFFMAIFLMDWVGLSLFTFLLPVIWFYSLFDALQCYDREPPAAQEPIAWDFEKQRMVGIALIIIGGLVLINKLAVPLLLKYLTYETLRLIGSSLVALLLIAGGIRLAWGKPISLQQLREEKMRMPARSLADNEGPSPRQPLPLENNSVPGQSLREEE
ncbi:MAG: hypothetical protein ACOX33_05885 [Dethiobacteria bacterium]|jgi:hypothetical protein